MADFLRYMLDNETSIAEQVQFVPLNEEQLAKAKERPRGRDRVVTSHDLTADSSGADRRRPAPFARRGSAKR